MLTSFRGSAGARSVKSSSVISDKRRMDTWYVGGTKAWVTMPSTRSRWLIR